MYLWKFPRGTEFYFGKNGHIKSCFPVGNSHLPVGKMGNLAAPILGRLKRICYGQRLTYVHYKLNYSFLSQTKELRETNTMLNKKNSRLLRKVQMLIVMCHLREMVTWIHRKRITDLTALYLWMVRYFDSLIPNICLCLLLLWSSLFLATPPSNIMELKQRHFWATHVSWKWGL